MTQPDIIKTILKDSNYHLDLFDASEIQALREEILIQSALHASSLYHTEITDPDPSAKRHPSCLLTA